MRDPGGEDTYAHYEQGFITVLSSREGTMTYGWYGTVPGEFTYPLGNKVQLGRDNRGNLMATVRKAATGSTDTDIQTLASYPLDSTPTGISTTGCQAASQKLCNKPITKTDERGNVTDYTYDSAHGMVLTETLPAATSGAPRAQTRYTYAQRYALISNGSGGFVQAATPVWLLTSSSFCRTGAVHSSGTGCAISGDEVVTAYDYGPTSGAANNLLLRGMTVTGDGVTRRTCYLYDKFGNKISETGPGALATSCP
jgi:YD repeat-containing protein